MNIPQKLNKSTNSEKVGKDFFTNLYYFRKIPRDIRTFDQKFESPPQNMLIFKTIFPLICTRFRKFFEQDLYKSLPIIYINRMVLMCYDLSCERVNGSTYVFLCCLRAGLQRVRTEKNNGKIDRESNSISWAISLQKCMSKNMVGMPFDVYRDS